MKNIWFTSDTHYGHKNICRGTSDWGNPQKTRDFNTIEEMNEALIKSINGLVKEDDILYHLGDWSFGGIDNIMNFRRRINCKEIHIILGNHDHHIAKIPRLIDLYSKELQEATKAFASISHYKELDLKINCMKTGKYGKTLFVLSHYAMRVWNKSHHGSIMLYGHSHGTLDKMTPEIANPTWIGDQYYIKNYKTMDVGVDTHNLYPYHLDEILDIMKGREVILEVDHHNENTN